MTVQFEAVNPATLEIEKNKKYKLELIEQVARAMNLSSGEEMASLKTVLFPSLLCSVVFLGDREKLESLQEYRANLNCADYTGKTALHVAASSGFPEISLMNLKDFWCHLICRSTGFGTVVAGEGSQCTCQR